MTRIAPIGLAVLLLGAGACNMDFSESSEIDRLRVLAVRADPPEIKLDAPRADATDPLGLADALIVGAEGELTYAWSLCLVAAPLNLGTVCFDPQLEIPLGEGETAEIPSLEDALAVLEDLSAELGEDVEVEVDLEDGVDIRLVLEVTETREGAVHDVETAVHPVTLSLKEQPNRNPRICSVEVEGGPEACDPETGCDPCAPELDPWPPTQRLRVEENQRVDLEPVFPSDARETYADDDAERQEELLFSWFATDGAFDKNRSSERVTGNTWVSPRLDEGEAERFVDLWLVMRDDRGGVDWLQREIRVAPADPVGE